MFGEYVKEKRVECGLSLREFCRKLEHDASNWSKIERGVFPPPQDEKKLKKIADILGINKNTKEWEHFVDEANVDAGNIPEYIMSDKEVVKALPAFFRTVRSVKPTAEELEKLIDIIKKGA